MRGIFLLSIAVSLLIMGCSTISRINDYSTSAVKTLKKYEELNYTFGRACRDKCYLEQVRNLQFIEIDCNCVGEKTADSITSVLYSAVNGYFAGLHKLSADHVTTFKTQALTKQLKNGKFGDFTIGKPEVDAYAKLATLLLRAFTDGYRNKELKNYIEGANEPVQVLISALEYNLANNLAGKINVHKSRIQSTYFDLFQDSSLSAYEKKKIIDDYNIHLDEADFHLMQIVSFTKGLKSIRAGHQKLFDNRNKLKARELKDLLAQYASDLEDIISDFNKLKNK